MNSTTSLTLNAILALSAVGALLATADPGTARAAPTNLGSVCHIWNHKAHRCAKTTPVFGDGDAVYYVSKLEVDADGAARAYHPGDVGSFDYLSDIDAASLHGIQGRDAIGPAPGFYVSGTSLHLPRGIIKPNDTRYWVDADKVPYFVSPLPLTARERLPLGSLAFVVDLQTGAGSGAILADTGKAVGEGSIALARSLGLDPISKVRPPKVVGFGERQLLYVVFPSAVAAPPWQAADIQREAFAHFQVWNQADKLHVLYPACPPLRPAT